MKVNEIFLSIQGESLSAGFPTVFVRFTGCNLRCSYCDTRYAYNDGFIMKPVEVFGKIESLHYKRVCLTGGEPLLQQDIKELIDMLDMYYLTIETNGSVGIENIKLDNPKHSFVMDMKTPSSGCAQDMRLDNFKFLREYDELKFVIGDIDDYNWLKKIMDRHYKKGIVTVSPVFGKINYETIVEWILADKLDVRFQLQLHKIIWGSERTGV